MKRLKNTLKWVDFTIGTFVLCMSVVVFSFKITNYVTDMYLMEMFRNQNIVLAIVTYLAIRLMGYSLNYIDDGEEVE